MSHVGVAPDSTFDEAVLAPLGRTEDYDDRIVNELYGFVVRCASYATEHREFFYPNWGVSGGAAISIAGSTRAELLIGLAVSYGLLTQVDPAPSSHGGTFYRVTAPFLYPAVDEDDSDAEQ